MRDMDAQHIDDCFAMTEPGRGRMLGGYALIAVAVVAFFLPTFQGDRSALPRGVMLLLPWIVVLGLLGARWVSARREARHRRAISRAWEHAQLEAWPQVEASLAGAMNRPIRSATDRCQVFILLAGLAQKHGLYEAAARIYERLLLERIGDGYQLQQAQLALAEAKLRNEELTDGVRMLDRLEHVPMPLALRAVYALVRLYQQVFMGQFEDAVEDLPDRRALFRRYLSTRAGYGYGLLAAALHHLGRREEASRLWRDATTLIPAARLVHEYKCLSDLGETYPATEAQV